MCILGTIDLKLFLFQTFNLIPEWLMRENVYGESSVLTASAVVFDEKNDYNARLLLWSWVPGRFR